MGSPVRERWGSQRSASTSASPPYAARASPTQGGRHSYRQAMPRLFLPLAFRSPPAAAAALRVCIDLSGATAVEFAILAPIVIATILGALQIAAIYLAQAELENAAEVGARLVADQSGAVDQRLGLPDCGLRLPAGPLYLRERDDRSRIAGPIGRI